MEDETYLDQRERNSLFDQVDEDSSGLLDEPCDNCGDDDDVMAIPGPAGPEKLCTECRLGHVAFYNQEALDDQDSASSGR